MTEEECGFLRGNQFAVFLFLHHFKSDLLNLNLMVLLVIFLTSQMQHFAVIYFLWPAVRLIFTLLNQTCV